MVVTSVSQEANKIFLAKREVRRPPKNSRKIETIVGANDYSTTERQSKSVVKPVTKAKRRVTKKIQESNNIINSQDSLYNHT